ncbi:hypothetical protein WMF31_14835 [Sorangium sp. So ce1036]|uniref:hypothetical protein n=1 Tax=Sorangium sp. So ce1036 TaxID=3133328 RepID=UPI003F042653
MSKKKKHRVAIALAVAVLGSFAGCWTGGMVDVSDCDMLCYGLDPFECDDRCEVCRGGCMEIPPLGFADPILLWMGDASDEADVPECPAEAPEIVFDGYGGFTGEHACPSCRCAAPSCELPSALTGSASPACDGQDPTSFSAPPGWAGACTAPAAVPSGALGSLLIPAPTVSACEPTLDPAAEPLGLPAPWGRRARGCGGSEAKHTCRDPSLMCIASPVPQPEEFSMCVLYLRKGVPRCPEEYPELHEFHRGVDDTRGCTPCACGPAEGSACTALVSAYEDGGCARLLGAETVTLARPGCVTGPDIRLASWDAQWIEDEPGACAPSGGAPTGAVTPEDPAYFCCLPNEVPVLH